MPCVMHNASMLGASMGCHSWKPQQLGKLWNTDSCVWVQGWEIPSSLTSLHEYMKRIQSRDSWKQTYYPPEKV